MNHEERFERIEHVIAGLAEQRRQDREEYRQLRHDTERQIRETNEAIRHTNEVIDRFAEESRAADAELGRRIAETDKQSKIRDEQLGRRIESLVSSIGELVTTLKPQK
jgi:ferritin-like metal-binding protein YciE